MTQIDTPKDGRIQAKENEIAVLLALRDYGHLRLVEIGLRVWPNGSPESQRLMAHRTVKRLAGDSFVAKRQNAVGGQSFILTERGANRLRGLGYKAVCGVDLSSVSGPQFWHRTLGTRACLELERQGKTVYGEYTLHRHHAPVDPFELRRALRKLPDGLVLEDGAAFGHAEGEKAAYWLEVESSYKRIDQYIAILKMFKSMAGTELGTEGVYLERLCFVYAPANGHERRLLFSIRKFLAEEHVADPDRFMSEIMMLRCYVDPPFIWRGFHLTDALTLSKQVSTSDLDAVGDPTEELEIGA